MLIGNDFANYPMGAAWEQADQNERDKFIRIAIGRLSVYGVENNTRLTDAQMTAVAAYVKYVFDRDGNGNLEVPGFVINALQTIRRQSPSAFSIGNRDTIDENKVNALIDAEVEDWAQRGNDTPIPPEKIQGGGGDANLDDVADWAEEGNTDPIPAEKLTNAPSSPSGGGLSQSEVDQRVRVGVEDWAQQGNSQQIPANKLQNAPTGSGGLSQSQVDARVTAGVQDWAESGNTTTIPDNKIPASIARDTEIDTKINTGDRTITGDVDFTGTLTKNGINIATIADISSGGGGGGGGGSGGVSQLIDTPLSSNSRNVAIDTGADVDVSTLQDTDFLFFEIKFDNNTDYAPIYELVSGKRFKEVQNSTLNQPIRNDRTVVEMRGFTIDNNTTAPGYYKIGRNGDNIYIEITANRPIAKFRISKISFAGGGSGGGFSQSQIVAMIQSGVADWAESGNTSEIDNSKIPDLDASKIKTGTIDSARLPASANASDWAQDGNTDLIPAEKLPESAGGGTSRLPVTYTDAVAGTLSDSNIDQSGMVSIDDFYEARNLDTSVASFVSNTLNQIPISPQASITIRDVINGTHPQIVLEEDLGYSWASQSITTFSVGTSTNWRRVVRAKQLLKTFNDTTATPILRIGGHNIIGIERDGNTDDLYMVGFYRTGATTRLSSVTNVTLNIGDVIEWGIIFEKDNPASGDSVTPINVKVGVTIYRDGRFVRSIQYNNYETGRITNTFDFSSVTICGNNQNSTRNMYNLLPFIGAEMFQFKTSTPNNRLLTHAQLSSVINIDPTATRKLMGYYTVGSEQKYTVTSRTDFTKGIGVTDTDKIIINDSPAVIVNQSDLDGHSGEYLQVGEDERTITFDAPINRQRYERLFAKSVVVTNVDQPNGTAVNCGSPCDLPVGFDDDDMFYFYFGYLQARSSAAGATTFQQHNTIEIGTAFVPGFRLKRFQEVIGASGAPSSGPTFLPEWQSGIYPSDGQTAGTQIMTPYHSFANFQSIESNDVYAIRGGLSGNIAENTHIGNTGYRTYNLAIDANRRIWFSKIQHGGHDITAPIPNINVTFQNRYYVICYRFRG